MATKLKLGTDNNWATKKGNLLAYNDENGNFKPIPFDATRASTATRVNKAGLIETVEQDRPRVEFDNNDGYVLLEPTRTNIVTQSSNFSTWSTSAASISTNQDTAPNGSNEANKVTPTSSGLHYIFPQTVSITTSTTYTLSIFAKKKELQYIQITGNTTAFGSGQYANFDLENGTLGNYAGAASGTTPKIEEYTNNWYKCTFTITSVATTTQAPIIVVLVGSSTATRLQGANFNGTDALYLWGGQVEVGNYPTSLIPTAGSAVTRTEDNVQIASGAGDIIGSQNEGTLFIDLEIPYDTDSTEYFQFCISDQVSTANRVLFNFISGEVRFQVLYGGGSGQGFCNTSTPKNTRLKIAGSYKTNEFVLYKNGSLADTIDTTGVIDFTTQMETLRFADFGNGKKFQAKVYQMMFFKEALTQSELIKLTS